MDTFSTVQRLIAEEAGVDAKALASDSPLEAFGVDSLKVLEVMFRLEDVFGVRIPEERTAIHTVQDVADLVDRLLIQKAASSS